MPVALTHRVRRTVLCCTFTFTLAPKPVRSSTARMARTLCVSLGVKHL